MDSANEHFTCSPTVNSTIHIRLHQARWRLWHSSHWPRWTHSKMGCNPILKWLCCGQWELGHRRYRSFNADGWCKRALRQTLKRSWKMSTNRATKPKITLRHWTFAFLARKWRHDIILCKHIPTNDCSLLKISRSEEFHFGGSSHTWVTPTRECPLHTWVTPTRECPLHMWVTPTCECPLHTWVTPTHECPLHTWVTHTHECPLHMWVTPTRECPLHTWVTPTRKCPHHHPAC